MARHAGAGYVGMAECCAYPSVMREAASIR